MEPIKLTAEQLAALPKAQPRQPWEPDPAFFGTPVVKVDSIEDSTPYQLWLEQQKRDGWNVVKFDGQHYAFNGTLRSST